MKTPILPILLCCSLYITGQEQVSFTNQGSKLGFVPELIYNDCAVDMNGDHLDDIVRPTFFKLYIDYQQPDGSFESVVFEMNTTIQPDWSICAGDLDGNGFNDLLYGGGDKVSFLMANDNGTDYTEIVMPDSIFSQRSTMADIDNDGDLDAFVCDDNELSHPFRNDGFGNMTLDQNLIVTADRPGNYSAIWTDYDNDDDIDLYITKCKGGAPPGDINRTNLLYQNNGDGTYSEVAAAAGLDDNAQSWSTVFEDFDNDGDFDAFILNHDFKNRFFRNNGDGTFTDIIDQTGIDFYASPGDWNNASGDFNNDGYMDIFSELDNEFYLGNGDLTFTGQTINELFISGGIGDFNNDGFLDVVRSKGLWINDGNDNNWLKVNLIGIESNPNGIGARVEVYGSWGKQSREVRSGQSFSPMSSLQTHFGLGQADSIEKLVVRWPSGIVTTVDSLSINSTVTVPEASCLLPPSDLSSNGNTAICPGDSVDLIAPDGFAYAWSNGDTTQTITVTQPNTYYAILTDTAGCASLSSTIEVTTYVDSPPTITIDGPDIICEGELITLTASAGENPTWSNGMNGQTIDITESGDFTVTVNAVCTSDLLTSDTINITVLPAPSPIVTGATIDQGQSIEITAEGDSLEWYDMAAGGTLLATGDALITPNLDLTTTYYVESHNIYPGEIQSGGKPDNSGGGGWNMQGAYNFFDVWESFTLLSVKVYVPTNTQAGERTIQLADRDGVILAEKKVDLDTGAHIVELNFDVPTGADFSLRNTEANLFRNNSGVNYPYPIGDVGEMTTSLFGLGHYYYFYDWKVQKEGYECVSERVSVTIEVTDAVETFAQAGFSIFPNPTSEELSVKMENPADQIRLFDFQGKVILEKETVGNSTEVLKISELAIGIYTIQIMADGAAYHSKFVKH